LPTVHAGLLQVVRHRAPDSFALDPSNVEAVPARQGLDWCALALVLGLAATAPRARRFGAVKRLGTVFRRDLTCPAKCK